MCASACGLVYATEVPWREGRGWQVNRTGITGDSESYPAWVLGTDLRFSISNLSTPLFLYYLNLEVLLRKEIQKRGC